MNRKKSPCKDCGRRKSGCHSKCDDYKAYKEKLEAEKVKLPKRPFINIYRSGLKAFRRK